MRSAKEIFYNYNLGGERIFSVIFYPRSEVFLVHI